MSDNTDQQLRLKQEIIKAEIIDKNYDKDKFLAYCINKKENGDDLSKWSLLELNTAISEFITSLTQPPSQQQQQPNQQQANTNTINVDIDKLKICRSNDKPIAQATRSRSDLRLKEPFNDALYEHIRYAAISKITNPMYWLMRISS